MPNRLFPTFFPISFCRIFSLRHYPAANWRKPNPGSQEMTSRSAASCYADFSITCNLLYRNIASRCSTHFPITGVDDRRDFNSHNNPSASKLLKTLHISTRLMEDFLALSKSNTEKDLETCGILGAYLEKGTFYVATLIIPKQESTSNSCQAVNEEEVYMIHSERSLCPVGWIHTNPSQSCFMSSIDLHTHYPYQAMVPEAFAIVLAPTDASRSFGIFRLSDPGGMKILRECREDGFHPHKDPEDGSPISSSALISTKIPT